MRAASAGTCCEVPLHMLPSGARADIGQMTDVGAGLPVSQRGADEDARAAQPPERGGRPHAAIRVRRVRQRHDEGAIPRGRAADEGGEQCALAGEAGPVAVGAGGGVLSGLGEPGLVTTS